MSNGVKSTAKSAWLWPRTEISAVAVTATTLPWPSAVNPRKGHQDHKRRQTRLLLLPLNGPLGRWSTRREEGRNSIRGREEITSDPTRIVSSQQSGLRSRGLRRSEEWCLFFKKNHQQQQKIRGKKWLLNYNGRYGMCWPLALQSLGSPSPHESGPGGLTSPLPPPPWAKVLEGRECASFILELSGHGRELLAERECSKNKSVDLHFLFFHLYSQGDLSESVSTPA